MKSPVQIVQLLNFALMAFCGTVFICSAVANDQQVDLTKSHVLELAKHAFIKSGRKIADYEVTVEKSEEKSVWVVWFEQKGIHKLPGGRHLVTVDVGTGVAVFKQGE